MDVAQFEIPRQVVLLQEQYEGVKMSNWNEMSWQERTDRLLYEMRHKDNQVAALQRQINEMGEAIVALEKKIKEQ